MPAAEVAINKPRYMIPLRNKKSKKNAENNRISSLIKLLRIRAGKPEMAYTKVVIRTRHGDVVSEYHSARYGAPGGEAGKAESPDAGAGRKTEPVAEKRRKPGSD